MSPTTSTTIYNLSDLTAFTQPTSCSSSWHQSGDLSIVVSDELNPNWASCQTSSVSTTYYYETHTSWYNRAVTLSPAVCPTGWTVAWSSIIRVLTTVAFCCSEYVSKREPATSRPFSLPEATAY